MRYEYVKGVGHLGYNKDSTVVRCPGTGKRLSDAKLLIESSANNLIPTPAQLKRLRLLETPKVQAAIERVYTLHPEFPENPHRYMDKIMKDPIVRDSLR